MNSLTARTAVFLFGSILLGACGQQRLVPTAGVRPAGNKALHAQEQDFLQNFSNYLSFDAIRPIYNPEFASAEDAPYQDDELVLGITLGGQAKAYSVTVLRVREIVNDELAGIPVLVTW